VAVIELFVLAFFSAVSDRGKWKSVFSLAVVLQPPVETIFPLAVFKQTASVNGILTDGFIMQTASVNTLSNGGFIKQTASVNILSTSGFLYLAASGSFPHFFKFLRKTEFYIFYTHILKATWN
jgi:hypothetical protein